MFTRLVAIGGGAAAVVAFAAAPALADGAVVNGYSPSSAAPGTQIDVNVAGFGNVTDVTFGGGVHATQITQPSPPDVLVIVPAGAQSGAVTVSDGTTSATGPAFTVLPTLTLAASATQVTYPGTVALTATLTSGGVPAAGQPVALQLRPGSAQSWAAGPTATTDGNGQAHFTVRPLATTAYQAVYNASATYGAATSAPVSVTQHPQVTFALPSTLPILTNVAVKGHVRPAQTGTVTLQRHDSSGWHGVATAKLTSAGNYAFTLKLPKKGTYTYRVRRPADVNQAGTITSSMKVLGVDRTLRQGMKGPDVKALQKQLVGLHYDLGHVSGTFDFDTYHAVVAFEKIQRLSRDGTVGLKVWKALANPRTPRMKHPLHNVAAFEVDLTRQVVFYAVDGKIARIFDSSTGGGYYYTGSDGTTQRAITPTGHFSVKYKVNGWVKSKLGVLYRPAYFNYDGYAIHGEPEVPSYPASHGCVRITVPAMDRIYAKIFTGMSVWIYRS